jgi:hypothetical protein
MADEAYAIEGTKANFPELVRRSPDFRGGLPPRALAAMLDTLEPDDPPVNRLRHSLFEH